MGTTAIWYKDPVFAFGPNELHMFFPTRKMTLQQQLNSVMRLSIYWSIAVTFIKRDVRYMLPLVLTALVTFAVNEAFVSRGVDRMAEQYTGHIAAPCVPPTDNNPHMNVMLGDYIDMPNRPSACDVTNPVVKQAVRANTPDLPQDDPFADGRMDRQFYTMPSTTIPNDQTGYRNFLFGDVMKPTVKTQHGY